MTEAEQAILKELRDLNQRVGIIVAVFGRLPTPEVTMNLSMSRDEIGSPTEAWDLARTQPSTV